MLRLRRLHLDQIGDTSARFTATTFDLRDPADDAALDTIIWLRNGGGKTSLLSLAFSLILPAQREFLGTRREDGKPTGRCLADYVATRDTSHVVAEWDGPEGLIVTGAVYEWPDRRRPNDHRNHQSDLTKRWYAFRPVEGVLTFDSLPVRDGDGRRVPLEGYMANLRTIGRNSPNIQMHPAAQIIDWHRALNALLIDPDAFRYQKEMNGREGGIDDLFRFRNAQAFIDFFIDLVADTEAQTSLRDRLRQQADRLASRPSLRREHDYCTGVATRLDPLGAAWANLTRRREDLDAARETAIGLAGAFDAGRAASEAAELALDAEVAAAQGDLATTGTERRSAQDRGAEYRRRGAEMWEADAQAAVEAAAEVAAAAVGVVAGWDAVEDILAVRAAATQLREVEADIEQRAAAAEPDRDERDRIAAALRARLRVLAVDLRLVEKAAAGQSRDHLKRVERLAAAALDAKAAAGSAGSDARQAEARLAELDAAFATARAADHLGAGESPAAAVEHVVAVLDDLRSELGRLDRAAARRREERERLSVLRSGAETVRATQTAAADVARGETDSLRAQAAELSALERVREIAQTDDVSLWSAAPVILDSLDDSARRAAARTVELGVHAAVHDRNHAALVERSLLPPSADVEALLSVLEAAGIRALPGLSFLSQSVARRNWEATIGTHPGLLAGIVVDAAAFDQARRVTIDAGLHPASLVTVATKQAVLDGGGERAFVVPPSPALFDETAAEGERARLRSVLDQVAAEAAALTRTAEADWALHATITAFLTRCPAGRIDELDEEHRTAAAKANAAAEQLEELAVAEGALAEEERAEEERRPKLAAEITARSDQLAALRPLAASEARRPEWVAERDDAIGRAADAEKRAAVSAEAAEQERGAAAAAAQLGADAGRHAASLETEHERVRILDVSFDESVVTDDAAADLDELRRQLGAAHERWERAVSDDALSERHRQAVLRDTDAASRLGRHDPDATASAERLLGEHGAFDVEERAARRQRAVADAAEASAAQQAAAIEHAEATREVEAARRSRTRALPPGEEPTDRLDAARRRLEAEEAAAHLQAAETDLERKIERLGQERGDATQRASMFRTSAKSLAALVGTDLVEGVSAFSGSLADAEAEQDDITRIYTTARDAEGEAVVTLEEAAGEVRRFAGAFTNIGRLLDAVVAETPEILAASAGQLAGTHRERAAVIGHDLAALDVDRDILVTELTGQVRRTLELIARAPRTSELPEELGPWARKQFLTISFDDPRDAEAELRRRVGEEIDRVVEAGKIPDGLDTLKRALHASVPKGFKVRVLKPTPDLTEERVDITIMSDWSGGEKLTAAVLLYCTLARLRNRKGSFGGGALILDNPLGTSNYVRFVALQRRVAAALRVQLIYTTGVKDISAVGTFPNVVRCRNVRPTGHDRRFVDASDRVGEAHGRPLGEVATSRIARADGSPDILVPVPDA